MNGTSDKLRRGGFTRRRFILGALALAGGGLALRWATREPDSLRASNDILEPNAFLQITPDGRFIFQLDRVEMGQGTMTGLLTLVAEELDVDPARFEVQFAPVRPTFQRPLQMTGQSRSMVDSWEILRETGAAARAMLLEEAAAQWQASLDDLTTDDGVVALANSSSTLTYAELAAGAARRAVPWTISLKNPAEYRWIGTDVPRVDARAKVTGAAGFGIDVQVEGMLTAVVARCPEIGARLAGYDADKAASMPGVQGIVELPDGRGVAVVADNFWAAKQAADTIELSWDGGPLKSATHRSIQRRQRKELESAEVTYQKDRGDVLAALPAAARELEVEYTTPYLAHATMEPMNATAHVRGDSCELWAPTQTPDMARQVAADITGLPRAAITVHTTYLGGGFGRRVLWDFIEEAVWVAREFEVPVKVVWTREDDIRHGYFRQQTVHRVRGALDESGAATAWEHRQVAAATGELLTPPTMSTVLPEALSTETRQNFGKWMGRKTVQWMGAFQAREGAVELAYDIPNTSFSQITYDPGMPISIWRSVGNSYNGFVVESFVDELAHSARQDPLTYRRDRLLEKPRHLAVLDRLRDVSAWDAETPGRSKGMALFESFKSVVGQVAEVSVTGKAIRVHKVYCVVDCGFAVTPDIVKQQMESGIIYGLTAALYGEITLNRGRVEQSNFDNYLMVRLQDAPDIEVYIINSSDQPEGVGEPGTPAIAPAVANAVFAATGKRLRSLPLRL